MKALEGIMAEKVGTYLRQTERAHQTCTNLIRDPKGHKAEELEDALNELQDAAYHARRAFRVEAVR